MLMQLFLKFGPSALYGHLNMYVVRWKYPKEWFFSKITGI